LLQKGKLVGEMLLTTVILDAVFQPSFRIREEPQTTTRIKNNLEENAVHPGSACEQTRGNVSIIYSLL